MEEQVAADSSVWLGCDVQGQERLWWVLGRVLFRRAGVKPCMVFKALQRNRDGLSGIGTLSLRSSLMIWSERNTACSA